MNTFLFGLLANLALLTIVLAACHLYNRVAPGAALNGGYVFIALASAALLLDAALTFMVFADAQRRYGAFGAPAAFAARAGAYGIVALIAWACARVYTRLYAYPLRPSPDLLTRAQQVLVIRTSAYSESHLPM